ncbi:MAG: hypothetical protein LBH75_07860 [Treponema sp.]|jgi:hypothetical protein|nr:hypothetical protein [Treponema sp.]
MVRFLTQRQSFRILLACVAVSVMGMFSLAAVEPIRAIVFELKTVSDTIFDVSENYVDQYSTGEEAAIVNKNRAPFSPFRMGFHRAAFLFGGANGMANVFVQPSLPPCVRISRAHFNNAIPLILRI